MIFRKQKEISGHNGAIYTCVAKDNYIYSGSADKYVARWLIDKGIQDRFSIKFEHSIYSLSLYESFLFVGLSNGALHIIDLESKKEIYSENLFNSAIFSLQVNTVKGHLYCGDAAGNLIVRNLTNYGSELSLPLNCGKIRSLAVSNDGEQIALACQDGRIRIFDTTFFNEEMSIEAHTNGVTSLQFHPTNKNYLISGGKDAILKMWDLSKSVELIRIPAHNQAIYSMIFLEKYKYLATCSRDKSIKIWDAKTLTFLQKLDSKEGGHRHSVNQLFAINENEFVSCSDDKRLIVWEKKYGD